MNMAQTRVVVNLTQNVGGERDDANSEDFGGELSILDNKTVRLLCNQSASKPPVMVARKLRFDALYVDSGNEQKERELNRMLRAMFEKQRDCLLMQLTSWRGDNLMFLVDTLVIQINVKLNQYGLQLERCNLHYRNMMQGVSDGPLDTFCMFSGNKMLLNWLLNDFRIRTILAQGHEVLQVEYFVVNKEQGCRFSVTLHVLLVAMEELCRATLCSFRCFFSKDPIASPLSVTELTSYVCQAAKQDASKPLYLLMLCHVVVNNGKVNSNDVQLLGLANLASKQVVTKENPEPMAFTLVKTKSWNKFYNDLQKLGLVKKQDDSVKTDITESLAYSLVSDKTWNEFRQSLEKANECIERMRRHFKKE